MRWKIRNPFKRTITRREMRVLKMAYMARVMEASMPLMVEVYKDFKKKSE